jgi:hypothetical protein
MTILLPARMARALRDDSLSERSKHGVIVFGTLIGMLVSSQSLLGGRTYGELFIGVAYGALVIVGIRVCYRANGADSGRHFAERYVCLGVPTGFWVYGIYYIAYFGAYGVLRERPGFDAAAFAVTVRVPFLVLSFVAMGVYFWILRHYFRSIAGAAVL